MIFLSLKNGMKQGSVVHAQQLSNFFGIIFTTKGVLNDAIQQEDHHQTVETNSGGIREIWAQVLQ